MALTTPVALAKAIARQLFDSALPQGPAWFNPSALAPGKPVERLREGLIQAYGEFKAAAAELMANNSLLTATGTYLDDFGQDVGVPRNGDDDADYRLRIQNAILQASTTASELEALLEAHTGVDHSLFAPWTLEEVRGDRGYASMANVDDIDEEYGRSGVRVISSDYYCGGVLDVIAEDFSPDTKRLTEELVAAGVTVYLTTNLTVPGGASGAVASPARVVTAELEENLEIELVTAPTGSVSVSVDEAIEVSSVGSWNTLGYDTAIAWEDMAAYTWEQAIAGPLVALPRPELVVST